MRITTSDHVVLGVVYNATRDKALVARRPRDVHCAGLWEFPGGKARAGETALDALKRELYEEINIEISDCSPLISFDYDYPDRSLRLEVWKIYRWNGKVTGQQGQETQWVDISSLAALDFPPANKGIITACKLPSVYLITPDLEHYPPAFMGELQEYLAAGVRLAQFRSKKSKRHKQVAISMIGECRSKRAELLVNASPAYAMEVGASGVHLNSRRLLKLAQRPLPAGTWVAASCHNRRELAHAVDVGVDFCVLSPVRNKRAESSSSGNRGQSPCSSENILGWDGFSELVSRIPVPVYALGGMKLSDVDIAIQHGAQGVALISDVWSKPDAVARLKKVRDFE